MSIHHDQIPSDDNLHKPITTYYPYNNLSLSLRDSSMSETEMYPVIESIRNKSLWLSVIDVVYDITFQKSAWHVVHNFIHPPF